MILDAEYKLTKYQPALETIVSPRRTLNHVFVFDQQSDVNTPEQIFLPIMVRNLSQPIYTDRIVRSKISFVS
jgi:hypothetical protein